VGQVHMIDVHSGETLAVFDHHAEEIVRALTFSPDGRLLATALGQTIKIWDALSGVELATLPKAGGSVYDLAFTPDRRMLLSRSEGDLIELWVVPEEALPTAGVIGVDTASAVAPVDALQLQETVTDAVFSPDESNIGVSTASGAIWFWDLASGQAIPADSYHTDWVYRLAYNPAGTWLTSVSKDGDLQFTEWPRSYAAHDDEGQGELSALAYLPDGESVATSGQDGILRFWEMPYLASTLAIQAHPAWVWDVAVSPVVDLLATASADRSIKLWAIKVQPIGDQQASLIRTLTGHTAAVWGVDFAPDGRMLASASWDQTVRLWDVSRGEQLAILQGHTDWVYDVAFSPDGTVLASSSADGTVRLWDAATGEPLATLEGSGGRIWSVDFSHDGRYLVSGSEGAR